MLIFQRKWEQVGETFRRRTNRGVLGAGGDDVVVEGVPLDVQHVASVAWHPRLEGVHFTRLMGEQRQGKVSEWIQVKFIF